MDERSEELEYPSLLKDLSIPRIVITPSKESPALTPGEETIAQIMQQDEEKTLDRSETDTPKNLQKDSENRNTTLQLEAHSDQHTGGPLTPEDNERTVIQVVHNSLAAETVIACVDNLPDAVLSEELKRNGCSTDGTLDERRARMALLLSCHQKSVPKVNSQPPDTILSPTWIHSMIENTQLEIKAEIRNLADEITNLKSDASRVDVGRIEKTLEESKRMTRTLNDSWEKNLAATNQIKNCIDEFFRELNITDQKADELEKSLRTLKCDLKNYCNSAFFKEDSELIKQMHAIVTDENFQLHASSSGQSPRVSTRVSSDSNASTAPQPRRSTPPPTTSNGLQSRRSAGFSMTSAVQRPQPRTSLGHSSSRNQAPPSAPQETPHSQQYPSAPLANQSSSLHQQPKKFKTVLITDSILRHVSDMDTANALGKNHQLHLVNKRDSIGLQDHKMRTSIFQMEPDFIYVHLGVNDVSQNLSLKESLANFYSFVVFVEEYLPRTKLFISQPLMTGDPEANERIAELREALEIYVSTMHRNDTRPIKDRVLFMNPNNNFLRDGQLVQELYRDDGVHPSERGKDVILGNMRHSIHMMTRIVLDKPLRTSSQFQREKVPT